MKVVENVGRRKKNASKKEESRRGKQKAATNDKWKEKGAKALTCAVGPAVH